MSQPFTPRHWRLFLVILAVLTGSAAVHAGEEDHERARKALEAGEVLPLKTILELVERTYPGQVMDVELEREHEGRSERWIYKVKVLRTSGTLVKLKVDAREGSVLGSKSRNHPPAGER